MEVITKYVHTVLATGIKKDEPLNSGVALHTLESFSDSDDLKYSPLQFSQDLDEISLNSLDIRKPAVPLIWVYNGMHYGILREASNSLLFSFKDCSKNKVFVFLMTSLKEALGVDARAVMDAIYSWYICWKLDGERATHMFHANQAFWKESLYIFDDKSMLLS